VELESALTEFGDNEALAPRILDALARVLSNQGDHAQAITQERRALALLEQQSNPEGRAIAHESLAVFLELESGEVIPEASRHQLAAVAYRLVAGLRQHLNSTAAIYTIDFGRASERGVTPLIPTVAELLADPAFDSLARWLQQRKVDAGKLQADIDAFLKAIATGVAESESKAEEE
jgi:hypothetical protein